MVSGPFAIPRHTNKVYKQNYKINAITIIVDDSDILILPLHHFRSHMAKPQKKGRML